MLLPASQTDERLLADIREVAADDARLQLWWLGQSGFLVKQAGACLLFDPYLSDSLTEKYARTDKPHVRITERCMKPEALGLVVRHVTASHIHTDHLDAATLRPLAAAAGGIRLFLPHPIINEAKVRLGDAPVEYIGLTEGDGYADTEWEITAVPAAHNEVKRDDGGRCHDIGFIARRNGFTIYHSGDTLWHSGLAGALRSHRCDVMLLPINGNKPERRVAGNLNGAEAAALAKTCGARLVIPCHYDMFEFNTESPELFVSACSRLGQRHRVPRCGERVTLDPRPSPF